jgi:uncharacterized protein DUF4242
MEYVVLERQLDPPLRLEDVRAMEAQSLWCLEQHRVRHVTSLLSSDGRRLTCSFAAPDTESVRSVVRRLDVAYRRVWPATVHGPAELPTSEPLAAPGSAVVVVERQFADPVELAAIQGIEDRGAWCLEQHRVRFLRTWFSRDRRVMVCTYAAPDAEAVRTAYGATPGGHAVRRRLERARVRHLTVAKAEGPCRAGSRSVASRAHWVIPVRRGARQPVRTPWSHSARRTHFRSVSGEQPIFPAIDSIAAHCDAWSP